MKDDHTDNCFPASQTSSPKHLCPNNLSVMLEWASLGGLRYLKHLLILCYKSSKFYWSWQYWLFNYKVWYTNFRDYLKMWDQVSSQQHDVIILHCLFIDFIGYQYVFATFHFFFHLIILVFKTLFNHIILPSLHSVHAILWATGSLS